MSGVCWFEVALVSGVLVGVPLVAIALTALDCWCRACRASRVRIPKARSL